MTVYTLQKSLAGSARCLIPLLTGFSWCKQAEPGRLRSATSMAVRTGDRPAFRLRHFDCIGFDMDHTLCRYRLAPFFEMEYQALADYLIEHKGYDAHLRRPLADDVDFVHKGLVLDIERGNFLKLSACGAVLQASHGTKRMAPAEIAHEYGPRRTNECLQLLATDPLEAYESKTMQKKYRAFKDYFDLPSAVISARIVDLLDFENGNKPLEKYNFWRDVLNGLVDMFSRDNLKINAGGYYPRMRAHPGKFLHRASDKLKSWLREIHRRQVTFLISGSDPEYVDCVASYSLGNDWKGYFDYVVCGSKKPGFFTNTQKPRPFMVWPESDKPLPFDDCLVANQGVIYTQGNWAQLRDTMAEYAGVELPKCLYFGDHLIQDVLAGNLANMHVVAIVEELEVEANESSSHKKSSLFSQRWGSFFCDDDESNISGTARMNTLWASLIKKHSRLCVSHVENISIHSVDHVFAVDGNLEERFLGFVPTRPSCFK